MGKRKTTSQFIDDAKAVHGNKYDYSKVDYLGNKIKVCIICPIHGEFWQQPNSHLRGVGCFKCYHYSKRAYGVGICDVENNNGQQYYESWHSMLGRAVGVKYRKKNPTYEHCSVCKEWLYLSNFKQWFENPANGYQKGYHLDKDILVKGNTEYAPDKCCFVPQEINHIFAYKQKDNGLPNGVTLKQGRYISQISFGEEKKHLGSFDTPEEAFIPYKIAKEQHVKELAESYFKEGKITERVYQALMKYEVEITD